MNRARIYILDLRKYKIILNISFTLLEIDNIKHLIQIHRVRGTVVVIWIFSDIVVAN